MSKEIITAIKQRRSIFPVSYTQKPIPREDLNKIMDAARWAPTHRKTEPWKYKVLQDNALERLGQFLMDEFTNSTGKSPSLKVKKLAEKLKMASAVVLIFMDRDPKESVPEWEEIAAVSMSVQNMWLTASSLGYGAYWSSPKAFADMRNMADLKIEDRERFLGFFYMGTLSDHVTQQPQRKEVEEITTFYK